MIQNIGIAGEGKMGANILYYLSDMHYRITWLCNPVNGAEIPESAFRRKMERARSAGILDQNRFSEIIDKVKITSNPLETSSCDLIIEAIVEEQTCKSLLFNQLDKIVNPDCIFASNSSSILPSTLIPSDSRARKFLGLHFFYPVALREISEIIVTTETSEETILEIKSFLNTIRRKHILLDEKNGFILNRIFLEFQNEAFIIVNNGEAGISQIERITKEFFFPTGVFGFFDSVGLDIMLTSVKNYSAMDENPCRFTPLINCLNEHVVAGRLGKKTGNGFMNHEIDAYDGFRNNDSRIINRLMNTWRNAIARYSCSSGIPPVHLKALMDDYFGTPTPEITFTDNPGNKI